MSKIIATVIQFLRRPFPEIENWSMFFRYLTILSLFIVFFLFIFQPFGISTLESHVFLICLGFGSMTFLGALIYEMTIGQLLNLLGWTTNWTFGKWILNNLGIVLFISFANFIFSRLVLFGFIDWSLFPTMIYGTFMTGLIIFLGVGTVVLSRQERKYQLIANEINQGKNKKQAPKDFRDALLFDISTTQIKYIEALQNYVRIVYLDEQGLLKTKTERITLKEVFEKIQESPITKCHRSYLVNKDAIVKVAGNAQGLQLTLQDCDKIIPVSRSYVSQFKGA